MRLQFATDPQANEQGQTACDSLGMMMPDTKMPNPAPRVPADFDAIMRWANVVRQLISMSRSGGYAVLSIKIVVNSDGLPVQWAKPVLTKLEPRNESVEIITELIEHLTT